MLQRHDSMDSFTNMTMSIGDVGGTLNEKSDPEKADFFSTLSYGDLSIADVGGTLGDIKDAKCDNTLSPPMSPGSSSSSASSISYPEPVRIRQNSGVSIEVSSVRQGSTHIESNALAVPTINVSQSPSELTPSQNVAWCSNTSSPSPHRRQKKNHDKKKKKRKLHLFTFPSRRDASLTVWRDCIDYYSLLVIPPTTVAFTFITFSPFPSTPPEVHIIFLL